MPESFFPFLMRLCNIQLGNIFGNLTVVLSCNLKTDVTFVSESIFLCPMCLASLVLREIRENVSKEYCFKQHIGLIASSMNCVC